MATKKKTAKKAAKKPIKGSAKKKTASKRKTKPGTASKKATVKKTASATTKRGPGRPPKKAKRGRPPKRMMTTNEVLMSFYEGGIGALQEHRRKKDATPVVMRKALRSLVSKKKDIGPLQKLLDKPVASASRKSIEGRGRKSPAAGDLRAYKVQQVKKQPPFLRLPVSSLNLKKNAPVEVKFEKDRIVVQLA